MYFFKMHIYYTQCTASLRPQQAFFSIIPQTKPKQFPLFVSGTEIFDWRKRRVLGCWKWALAQLSLLNTADHVTKDIHICERFMNGGRKQRHFITFQVQKQERERPHPRLNPSSDKFWQISIPQGYAERQPGNGKNRPAVRRRAASDAWATLAWMKSSMCGSRPVSWP